MYSVRSTAKSLAERDLGVTGLRASVHYPTHLDSTERIDNSVHPTHHLRVTSFELTLLLPDAVVYG